MLESLLHHTEGLRKLSLVLCSAPLESCEDVRGTLHLGRLAQLHARLKQLLCASGRASMVSFSTNPRPHCGEQVVYDTEPILCSCYARLAQPSPTPALGHCHPDLSAFRRNTNHSFRQLFRACGKRKGDLEWAGGRGWWDFWRDVFLQS